MTDSEERPLKIRKLDLAFDDDRDPQHAFSVNVGSLKDEPGTSTSNDPAQMALPVIVGVEKFPLATNASDNNAADESIPAQRLSKNQLKKLLKAQKWEEDREYRKKKRREKGKEKKARKAERRTTLAPQNTGDVLQVTTPPKKWNRPIKVPITFVLDCSFDDLMTDAEIISLGSQLTRSYSENKQAPYQAHLIVSSFSGKLKQRFETVLANNHLAWKGVEFTAKEFVAAAREADVFMQSTTGGKPDGPFSNFLGGTKYDPSSQKSSPLTTGKFEAPKIALFNNAPSSDSTTAEGNSPHKINPGPNVIPSSFAGQKDTPNSATKTNNFGPSYDATANDPAENEGGQGSRSSYESNIVYLTSDSPNTLDILSPYTTYIIGGLVDKNRHKGICYKRAMERNIPTAKLPIGEYMTMQSRSVLTTNHVVEIMLKWLESQDWGKSFLQIIPKRKEARLKSKTAMRCDLQNKEDDSAGSCTQGGETFEGDENGSFEGDGAESFKGEDSDQA